MPITPRETAVHSSTREEIPLTGPLTALFATSVGVVVTNLYAPQTLIGPSLGLAEASGGFVSMATLLGYAIGLFLLVPLADLLENRKLIVRMLGCAAISAIAVTFAPSAALLLAILFILGAACSAIHILVPVAASMVPPAQRGRVIGDVMGGLMIGIVLSRPLASVITDAFGWRAFYGVSGNRLGLGRMDSGLLIGAACGIAALLVDWTGGGHMSELFFTLRRSSWNHLTSQHNRIRHCAVVVFVDSECAQLFACLRRLKLR